MQIQPGSAAAFAQLTSQLGAEGATVEATTVPGLYQVEVPGANVAQVALDLSASPAVVYANPVQTVQIQTVPNDPGYTSGTEWQLNGPWGINVPGAWTITTGSDGVVVADTDTGIAYNDPDLYDNVWINQAEIPSTVLPNLTDVYNNGVITFTDLNNSANQGPGKIVDTNGDGIITATDVLASTTAGGWADGSTQDGDTANPDDLVGWNFASISTSTPNGTNDPIDQNGHGTFTAGEIGAVTNNGVGVAGVDWNAQIMPVQFISAAGYGTDTAGAEAIEYAVDHGAKVINASWGGGGTDPTIAAAIQYADEHGVIIVAAAGNNGSDDDDSTSWFSPASYSVDFPNMITVAATDSDGNLASWSNYGVASVQVAAPGVNVYGVVATYNSTTGTYSYSYGYDSGTSMAAPLVTGTVALVEAAHPTWSMSQVIDAVLDTTTPDPNLVGMVGTAGIVNAAAAVANTDGPYVVSASPDGSVNSSSGLSSVLLDFNEEINPATFTASQVTLTGPDGTIAGVTVTPVDGSNDHEFTVSFPTQAVAGTYTLTVAPTVQDWYGNDLNQNRNGVNGEAADAFVETIRQTAPGSTDLFSITGIPSSVTAGTSESFTITVLSPGGGTDTGYVGTIEFASTDQQAVLPANFTFTSALQGTYTFNVTFKTAGNQTITATDVSNSAIIGSEDNIMVQAAAASSLEVSGFPTTVTAGTPETLTVTAYDAYGNVAPSYTGTVHFTSTDGQASLPGNYTVSPEQLGVFTVSATLKTAGLQSITATDTVTSGITGTDSGITVGAAVVTKLAITGLPVSVKAGTAVNVTVSARDAFGNLVAGYTGTVSFTSNDPLAVLPKNYTFTPADAGSRTFSVTFGTMGYESVTVTDLATPSLTATGTIVVNGVESPYGGTPWPVPGIIQAENFDNGGQFVAYYDTTPGNTGGAYRNTDVDIQATSDTGGGYNVGWVEASEWLNYTINVAAAGTYVLSIRVASPGQGGTFHVDFGGVNETGEITVPNTGGWQTWQTITTTVQLAAGQQIMQVDFDSNGATAEVGNFNWLELTAPPIVVNAGSSFSSNAGATATFAGTVSGGIAPYTYGWTFGDGSTSSGSVTPSHVYANPGTYTATLTATDSVGDVGTSNVVVTVNDVPPTVSVDAPSSGTPGTAVSFAATATDVSPLDQAAGFAYSWSFGDGATATGADPSHSFAAAGTYTYTVTATDEYGKSGMATGTISIGTGSTPYGGTPWPVPGIIQAENFDNGGPGVAYYTPNPGSGGDPYRGTEIGIQTTTDTGGGYNIGWISPTEWLNYTVNVAAAGTYQLSLRVASPGQGGTLHVDFGGVNETGEIAVPNTGGWQTWQTITTTVQLAAGQQIMQVDFDSKGASSYVCNFNWLELTASEGSTASVVVPASLATSSWDVSGGLTSSGTAAAANPQADEMGTLAFTPANNQANFPAHRKPSRRPALDGA